ncbi:MAG: hypothetical protein JW908_05150 [Anaerolineales bacterium]|nr:hypothetical protein [Anaerolineales bacterium]
MKLTPDQLHIIEISPGEKIFLEGAAGCGKTTVGVEWLLFLMAQGVPASSILLLVPQRTMAKPYLEAMQIPGVSAGGFVAAMTMGGMARRMVDLFWPLVADQAGFARPDLPPTFLTLETAQYYMAQIVTPLLSQGLLDSVVIDPNRLFSQIIDNLNKAAVVGFPYQEIGERLKGAWNGEPEQAHIYEDAQQCANHFRSFCLEHNLLDFSLQMEVFTRRLWHLPPCRDFLNHTYRHLLAENIEEDTPVAHDLLREWMPEFESALLIYDTDGGYRRFLGADPQSAYSLKEQCTSQACFTNSFVKTMPIEALENDLSEILNPESHKPAHRSENIPKNQSDPRTALAHGFFRYYPEMLDWIAGQVQELVQYGLPPGEIVILAPFLSDALRFSIMHRLEDLHIPCISQRPSRSLREEPVTQCLLTLAYLAHPEWKDSYPLSKFDVAYALMQAIGGMDLIRSQLLSEIVFHPRKNVPQLTSFSIINPAMQERITLQLGDKYETLRLWLEAYQQEPPQELDHFICRLFGEVLSQPEFGFHTNMKSGEVTANLIESIQKFRWVAGDQLVQAGKSTGLEYLEMVRQGVIAAQYLRSWETDINDAVLISPAYTYLISNRPIEVQFWLDIGSRGWFERLYQPLTHPYVLSRHWETGRPWTDAEEISASQDTLARLTQGLLRRCRQKVYLGLSILGEQGYEQHGPLLSAFQRLLQQWQTEGEM